MRTFFAFLCAGLVPAIFMTVLYFYGQIELFGIGDSYIWIRTYKNFALYALISFGHILILAVPAYFLLLKIDKINFWSTLTSGYILGAFPTAILLWPLQYSGTKSSASYNGVKTLVDGVPTTAGWVQYVNDASFMGAYGILAAFVFWLIAAPNKSSHSQP